MRLTFADILRQLRQADYVRMANQAINEAEFVLAALLPEELSASYTASHATIRAIPTMAGETGNDSPYVPTGELDITAAEHPLAKFTAIGVISENDQITYQRMRDSLTLNNGAGAANAYTQNFLLQTLERWITEAMRQRNEYLRGQALTTGQLVLRGGVIDLGVPEENRREFTGTQAFGGAESGFWQAVRWGDRQAGNNIRARLLSEDTLNAILDNPANQIAVTGDETSAQGNVRIVTVRKMVNNGATFSADVRDGTRLVAYRGRGKLRLPDETLLDLPYVPDGVISFIGSNTIETVAEDGTLSTREALGRTHIGPTVEGDGRPGVWMSAITPEDRPYHVVIRGAERVLPIIENPRKLAIATTEV